MSEINDASNDALPQFAPVDPASQPHRAPETPEAPAPSTPTNPVPPMPSSPPTPPTYQPATSSTEERRSPPSSSDDDEAFELDADLVAGLEQTGVGLAHLAGIGVNKLARRPQGDHRWFMTEDEAGTIGGALARIAARRIPDELTEGDGEELVTIAGTLVGYGMRNAMGITGEQLAAAQPQAPAPPTVPVQIPPPGTPPGPVFQGPDGRLYLAPPPPPAPGPVWAAVPTQPAWAPPAPEPQYSPPPQPPAPSMPFAPPPPGDLAEPATQASSVIEQL